MNRNKFYLLFGLAVILLFSFYYFNFYIEKDLVYIDEKSIKEAQEEKNVTNEDNKEKFEEEGYLVSGNPGYPLGKLFIIYEKPGSPALNIELVINEESECVFGGQKIMCLALSAPLQISFKDKRVLVIGDIKNEQVIVSKIESK